MSVGSEDTCQCCDAELKPHWQDIHNTYGKEPMCKGFYERITGSGESLSRDGRKFIFRRCNCATKQRVCINIGCFTVKTVPNDYSIFDKQLVQYYRNYQLKITQNSASNWLINTTKTVSKMVN